MDQSLPASFSSLLGTASLVELSATTATSFALIAAAEIGDKSQLVCMTLASRHRPAPVMLGALTAFALLNTLAVVFGVAIANWLPQYVVGAVVAILFALFGIHALRARNDEDDEEVEENMCQWHISTRSGSCLQQAPVLLHLHSFTSY